MLLILVDSHCEPYSVNYTITGGTHMSAKQVREILTGVIGESSVGATVYKSIVQELDAAGALKPVNPDDPIKRALVMKSATCTMAVSAKWAAPVLGE